nr:MAG: nonstructural protein [Microvirus sp.]
MEIFTIRDSKANAYLTPFFSPTSAVAIRSCLSAMQEEGHQFRVHVEDFSLYRIGSYDDDTGRITADDPEIVSNLVDLIPINSEEIEPSLPLKGVA